MTALDREVAELLAETAEALFARHSSVDARRALGPGDWSPGLWAVAAEAELPLLGVPEDRGGAGGALEHWAAVVRIAARHAAAIPLAESSIAAWLAAEAGLPIPGGPLALVRGTSATGVPYARHALAFVVLAEARVGVVTRPGAVITDGTNVAGEPRDDVRLALPPLVAVGPGVGEALELRLALARALLISGALEGALAVTVAHLRDRVQFGVALARLPLVRDRLAMLAEEVAAARAVTDAAVAAPGLHTVAAAKVRAGEAAGRGAQLAHQLNGALGMTSEHALQHFTRRLWAWRDEDGDERAWAIRLGRALIDGGGSALWPTLTA